MISLPEVTLNIENWINSNRDIFNENNVKVKFNFLNLEDAKFKLGISFEHETKLALLEMWSSGECDFVYENLLNGKSEPNYFTVESAEELLSILKSCYERFNSD